MAKILTLKGGSIPTRDIAWEITRKDKVFNELMMHSDEMNACEARLTVVGLIATKALIERISTNKDEIVKEINDVLFGWCGSTVTVTDLQWDKKEGKLWVKI